MPDSQSCSRCTNQQMIFLLDLQIGLRRKLPQCQSGPRSNVSLKSTHPLTEFARSNASGCVASCVHFCLQDLHTDQVIICAGSVLRPVGYSTKPETMCLAMPKVSAKSCQSVKSEPDLRDARVVLELMLFTCPRDLQGKLISGNINAAVQVLELATLSLALLQALQGLSFAAQMRSAST